MLLLTAATLAEAAAGKFVLEALAAGAARVDEIPLLTGGITFALLLCLDCAGGLVFNPATWWDKCEPCSYVFVSWLMSMGGMLF